MKSVLFYIKIIVILVALSILSGCVPRIFSHYTMDLTGVRRLISEDEDEIAIRELDTILKSSKDRLLRHMEMGMVYYMDGNFRQSIREWLRAEEMIEEFDRRPVISLREVGEGASSLALNDYFITYQGMSYERVLLHIYLSLAYLMCADYDEARVELKKAEQAQKNALERIEKREDAIRRDSGVAVGIKTELLNVYDTRMGISSTHGYNPAVLNPLVYYLSGWLYNVQGYPDEALIDFRRIRDMGVRQECIREEMESISLDVTGVSQKGRRRGNECDLLIIFQDGIIPPLEEIRVPFIMDDALLMISIPIYGEDSLPSNRLHVSVSGLDVETCDLFDVYFSARVSLRERALGIAFREAARLAFKGAMSLNLSKKGGDFPNLFSNLYNVLSERADLRSWLTLPAVIQIGRMRIPPGRHILDLSFEADGMRSKREIELKSGEYKILDIRKIGTRIIFHGT